MRRVRRFVRMVATLAAAGFLAGCGGHARTVTLAQSPVTLPSSTIATETSPPLTVDTTGGAATVRCVHVVFLPGVSARSFAAASRSFEAVPGLTNVRRVTPGQGLESSSPGYALDADARDRAAVDAAVRAGRTLPRAVQLVSSEPGRCKLGA